MIGGARNGVAVILSIIECVYRRFTDLSAGPREATVGQIREFMKLFIAPGFLAYISVIFAASLVLIFYFAPKYGRKSMLWYIMICSMIGGISVSVTTGLGAAIVQTAMGDNQVSFLCIFQVIDADNASSLISGSCIS